jgi:hypothetical protein
MAKRKYIVLAPVEADRRYDIGESITLDSKEAAPLLAVAAIVEPAGKTADGDDGQGEGTGGEG